MWIFGVGLIGVFGFFLFKWIEDQEPVWGIVMVVPLIISVFPLSAEGNGVFAEVLIYTSMVCNGSGFLIALIASRLAK